MSRLEIATMAETVGEIGRICVLVVEDEFLISEWVAESLTQQGFAVSTATNAADALRQLQSSPVDVLFTDINLPGSIDGTMLARRARELLPELTVAYASGRVNTLDQRLRVAGSVFVAKPYVPAQLGRLLADTFNGVAARVPA